MKSKVKKSKELLAITKQLKDQLREGLPHPTVERCCERYEPEALFKRNERVTVLGHSGNVRLILGRGGRRGNDKGTMNYLIELDDDAEIAEWDATPKERKYYGMLMNKRYKVALESWLKHSL